MSALAIDLRSTAGFLVADARGRVVGTVECPMYGTSPETPDALAVRSGFFSRRRRLVPAESIEQIDDGSKVIGLRVDRDAIRTFSRALCPRSRGRVTLSPWDTPTITRTCTAEAPRPTLPGSRWRSGSSWPSWSRRS